MYEAQQMDDGAMVKTINCWLTYTKQDAAEGQ